MPWPTLVAAFLLAASLEITTVRGGLVPRAASPAVGELRTLWEIHPYVAGKRIVAAAVADRLAPRTYVAILDNSSVLGEVVAFNTMTGDVVWRRPLPTMGCLNATVSVALDVMFDTLVATSGFVQGANDVYEVCAADALTGEPRWSASVGPLAQPPMFTDDKKHWVALNADTDTLQYVTVQTGSTLWSAALGGWDAASVASVVVAVESIVVTILTVPPAPTFCFHERSGALKWNYSGLCDNSGINVIPAVCGEADRAVFVCSGPQLPPPAANFSLNAFFLSNATGAWSYPLGTSMPFALEADAGADDVVLVSSASLTAALDCDNARPRWQVEASTAVAATTSENRVFVPLDATGDVTALDRHSGTPLFNVSWLCEDGCYYPTPVAVVIGLAVWTMGALTHPDFAVYRPLLLDSVSGNVIAAGPSTQSVTPATIQRTHRGDVALYWWEEAVAMVSIP